MGNNGTQVAVEFEDCSEQVLPTREDVRRQVKRLEILGEGFRFELAQARSRIEKLRESEVCERRRADQAERECLQVLRRLQRIPTRIRSFFDRVHQVRRAWQVLTSQA